MFETTVDTYHAHIYHLLNALKKEQILMEAKYEHHIAGDNEHPWKKYKDVADRLYYLVNSSNANIDNQSAYFNSIATDL